jgi:hypothetical protein
MRCRRCLQRPLEAAVLMSHDTQLNSGLTYSPAGRTRRLPVGLCRRDGRAAGLGVPTRAASHNCPHPPFSSQWRLDTRMHDRAVGMVVGHAGRPDPAAARRRWPGSWAGSADSESRVPDTTLHVRVHLSLASRDCQWRVRYTIGRSGWASGMPAGRPRRLPVGLCRRHGRAAGPGVPTPSRECLTQPCTSIFHLPVETGDSEFDTRSGDRDGRRACRPAGPGDCPSAWRGSPVGAAGLGVPTPSRELSAWHSQWQPCTSIAETRRPLSFSGRRRSK